LKSLIRAQRVKLYIKYRINGKQIKELVGTSIDEAKDADGKRRAQKREGKIFEIIPDKKMTFKGLRDWYLNLDTTKNLKSYERIEDCLNNFTKVFGEKLVGEIKPTDLESYQTYREKQKASPATIDMELVIAKTMVNKAFDNDLVSGRTIKAFKSIKRKLKRGSNARERLLSIDEYVKLLDVAPNHLKTILIIAMNTGLRKGEILNLRWLNIDLDKGFIKLSSLETKEKQSKIVPINKNVKAAFDGNTPSSVFDHVVCYRGKPIAAGLQKSMVTACKKVGIEYGMNIPGGLRFHDIRTSVKTYMLRAGIDKALRDTILGHSLKGMDLYYIKPTDQDLQDAMNRYTEWLDDQVRAVNAKLKKGTHCGTQKMHS
jgi:integrase